ncbi:LmbE-like protein [Cenococcum geophilum 1.58]|uniref:LmbE-like protein n=1 Tax=Cenococcum geophilum 1.58 TaxID=794803 RepID=UPI00358DF31D|nr:LmbE-like protein [Cenococcum geophilum 1.58]
MGFFFFFVLPLSFFAGWFSLAYFVRAYFPTLHDKRIVLLIAHPDDEAMFFSPTVLALTQPSLRNHVKILCLCSGEDESLRETRKSELIKSAAILGLRSPNDVDVIEDTDHFPDAMTTTWAADDIANVLSQNFVSYSVKNKQKVSGSQTLSSSDIDIDVLITFDNQGISSHANHISLYYGALHWVRKVDPSGAAVSIYSLTTTNIVRKYISLFDAPLSVLLSSLKRSGVHRSDPNPEKLIFLSNGSGYRRAQKAMTDGHVSQMLWFRWGWIGLSRYVSVNDLTREFPAPNLH